jgi:hypothetical protein
MGIIGGIRLDRIRAWRQAMPPEWPADTPPMYEAALSFVPRPEHWWQATFESHFSGGSRSVLEWKGPQVKLACGMHDLALIPAAIAATNEDWRQYAPRLEAWDRGYEAYCKGEPPPSNDSIELVELDIDDFVPVEPGAEMADGKPASNDTEPGFGFAEPQKLRQG